MQRLDSIARFEYPSQRSTTRGIGVSINLNSPRICRIGTHGVIAERIVKKKGEEVSSIIGEGMVNETYAIRGHEAMPTTLTVSRAEYSSMTCALSIHQFRTPATLKVVVSPEMNEQGVVPRFD